jgi:Cd2+/Zn2+-exporting ATPase
MFALGKAFRSTAVIIEGESAVDQSSFTGESMPVMKKPGNPVFAASINQSGGLEARVTKLAKDLTIEKLILNDMGQSEHLVEEEQPLTSPITAVQK